MTAPAPSISNNYLKNLLLDLTGWLVNQALPVWTADGIDSDKGTCYEAIALDSSQGQSTPCRARVVPRQIYSFLEGERLGWNGPAIRIASDLHDWFKGAYLLKEGYFAAAVDAHGKVSDPTFDLYNQAFALFGFANVALAIPEQREEAIASANRLLDLLQQSYRHPEAGFLESTDGRLPLRSNPHMHLFEACLAWESVSEDPVWSNIADEIAELALTRFIDPVSGGLREFFDLEWKPFPGEDGRIMEPGHQFEWAWLLARWGRLRNDAGALIAARRLYDIGWTYGIDESRGAAFMALNDDFTVKDPLARLWAQTEWLKAAIALTELSSGPERDAYASDIPDAVAALKIYLKDVPKGLWRDKLSPDGTFVEEQAPASSLYHIVCAISELDRFTRTL